MVAGFIYFLQIFVVVLFWGRSVYSGAVWYHDHLNQGVPLVVITEDQQVHDLDVYFLFYSLAIPSILIFLGKSFSL